METNKRFIHINIWNIVMFHMVFVSRCVNKFFVTTKLIVPEKTCTSSVVHHRYMWQQKWMDEHQERINTILKSPYITL